MQYKAYTPVETTKTLLHKGTPLIKYILGLSNAYGIFVTLTAVNTVANLRSAPITIHVPVRNAGKYCCKCYGTTSCCRYQMKWFIKHIEKYANFTLIGYFSCKSIVLFSSKKLCKVCNMFSIIGELPVPNVLSVEHVNATAIQITWQVWNRSLLKFTTN